MTADPTDLQWYLENGGREALRSKGLEVSLSGDVREVSVADSGKLRTGRGVSEQGVIKLSTGAKSYPRGKVRF